MSLWHVTASVVRCGCVACNQLKLVGMWQRIGGVLPVTGQLGYDYRFRACLPSISSDTVYWSGCMPRVRETAERTQPKVAANRMTNIQPKPTTAPVLTITKPLPMHQPTSSHITLAVSILARPACLSVLAPHGLHAPLGSVVRVILSMAKHGRFHACNTTLLSIYLSKICGRNRKAEWGSGTETENGEVRTREVADDGLPLAPCPCFS